MDHESFQFFNGRPTFATFVKIPTTTLENHEKEKKEEEGFFVKAFGNTEGGREARNGNGVSPIHGKAGHRHTHEAEQAEPL